MINTIMPAILNGCVKSIATILVHRFVKKLLICSRFSAPITCFRCNYFEINSTKPKTVVNPPNPESLFKFITIFFTDIYCLSINVTTI